MNKAIRLQRLQDILAPRAAQRLPRIIVTVVETHAEHIELQSLRAKHRGPSKLPEGAGPIVRLTFAATRRLLISAAGKTRKARANGAEVPHKH
jgi:hypothetical protein